MGETTMTEISHPGWTRLRTATGRYEFQFQGSMPTVRAAQYLDAVDYQFLVMDEDGWLYKIPVRVAAEAAAALASGPATPLAVAEAQLRAGLELFRPRVNAPYEELDQRFAVDAARARELAQGKS
jgi:hypothetical protein